MIGGLSDLDRKNKLIYVYALGYIMRETINNDLILRKNIKEILRNTLLERPKISFFNAVFRL